MSRWVVFSDPRKKRRQQLFAWIMIGLCITDLIIDATNVWSSQPFLHFILPMYLLWSGTEKLIKLRREYFLEIDEKQVSWWLNKYELKQFVPWDEIRWIKKEANGSIAMFMASSFRAAFNPAAFPQQEQDKIMEELTIAAAAKQIPVVNLSSPVLQPA